MADELLERKQKTSSEVLSEQKPHNSYSGSGNPHLWPGELQKVWHSDKPGEANEEINAIHKPDE